MTAFYAVAGLNHFVSPEFYLPLIPDYFPYPQSINVLAGFVELGLAASLFFERTRVWGAYLIIAMLVAFIPSHVFFIQEGSCLGALCVPAWIGWARLLVVHPFLMVWAYSVRDVRLGYA